jgi:MFS transporter, NNP family, nitrate/nitrite transporter
VSFVTVPFVILITVAIGVLALCPDTPTGPWKNRHLTPLIQGIEVVDVKEQDENSSAKASGNELKDVEKSTPSRIDPKWNQQGKYDETDVEFAEASLVRKPSLKEFLSVIWSLPTLMLCLMYFSTFGAELAIESNLSSFYIKSSGKPAWSQTLAANWAAMYGLLNVVTRPLGGYIGDCLYPVAGVEGKKFWLITCTSSPTRSC